MKFQFIRLYVLLFIVLSGFLWAFNALYNSALVEPESYQLDIEHVFNSYRDEPVQDRPQLQILPIANFALPDDLRQLLENGEVMALEMGQGQLYYFQLAADPEMLMRYGPLPPYAKDSNIELYLVILFFTALALLMLVMMTPIFRDLNLLQQLAIRFGQKPEKDSSGIKSSSSIYPLASTFERMTAQIDDLLNTHKDMSRTIAHELRTPLARMKFALTLAGEDMPAEYRARLQQDIRELEKLAGDYLNFARLEYHEHRLDKAPHRVQKLLDQAEAKFAIYQNQFDWRFRTQIEQAYFEPESIMLALQNLLSNAMRFANKQIVVTFSCEQEMCVLSVEDDGPGIGEQAQGLTGAFVRDSQNQPSSSGYGLGLFIVQKVARWHQGELQISESGPYGGAKVSLRWPNQV